MAKPTMQVIKVKDYGDDWVNRLAVASVTLEKMSPPERTATLRFIKSKYPADWPSDDY